MRRFVVDAFHCIVLLSPRYQWHKRALAFAATLDAYRSYTTDEPLTELLAFYSTATATVYRHAVDFVGTIMDYNVPQRRDGKA
jgi:hypothetical protein